VTIKHLCEDFQPPGRARSLLSRRGLDAICASDFAA